MADDDPVAIVHKIDGIAIEIKDAVQKVTSYDDKKECIGIQKIVCRVSDLLSLLVKESEMKKHRAAVGGPLGGLCNAISRARDAVTACCHQVNDERENTQCSCCFNFSFEATTTRQLLNRQLSQQVKNDISQGMMLVIFASSHDAAVFVSTTEGRQSALNFDAFFLPTHKQTSSPPPSPNIIYNNHPPRAVTEDFPPSTVPANKPPSRLPGDAIVSDARRLPCSLPTQTQEPPPAALAPKIKDDDDVHVPYKQDTTAGRLFAECPMQSAKAPLHSAKPLPRSATLSKETPEPPSDDVDISPLALHSHPQTNVHPIESKHLSHRRPKQPPHLTTSKPRPAPLPTQPQPPSSVPLPTYVTSPMSKHQTHHPPTRPPQPSPSQRTMKDPLPQSKSSPSEKKEWTPSLNCIRISGERKNNSGQADVPLLKGLRKFTFTELSGATHNFSEKNKIGSSHFGIFYKGVLNEGLEVAIKKYQDPPQFLIGQLSAKLYVASKLQSKDVEAFGNNLYIIRVLGFGHEPTFPSGGTYYFLVEEYLANGNMSIIYGLRLCWTSRFRIIQCLAQGLRYLHEEHIVHLNVKPANVLLHSDMNPKITDFGIAKLLEKPIIQDNDIVGTVGYMPPEYILEGTLSKKYDVYSFGVTVLETISSMCKADPVRHHASVPWAWNVRKHQQMGELFDSSLFEESQLPQIKRCLEIGLLCTQFERAERPTMASVLEMVNGRKELTTPRQPEYTKRSYSCQSMASHKDRSQR